MKQIYRMKGAGLLKAIGILVVVLIGLFVIAAYFGDKDIAKRIVVADMFCERVQNGDYERALIVTSKAFKQQHNVAQLKQLITGLGIQQCAGTQWELSDRGSDGLGAVQGVVKAAGGVDKTVRMTFVEQGDDLRIAAITTKSVEPDKADTGPQLKAEIKKPDETDGEYRAGFSLSFSTAKFKNARITLKGEADAAAVSIIPRDVEAVYCVTDIAYAPPDTKLKAEWFYLGKGPEAKPQKIIESKVTTTQGTDYAVFSMTRSKEMMVPTGKYQARLYINDKHQEDVDFIVRDPTTQELLQKAKAGDVESQFGIFAYLILNKLEGITEQEAIHWLRKAAEGGHAVAQYNIAALHLNGKYGVQKDPVAMIDWMHKSAAQKNLDAAHHLAVFYREGNGVEVDMAKSLEWTQKAAEYGSLEAQYNMGIHYNTGTGVAKDPAEALKWFRKAAEGGFAPAIKILESAKKAQ